MPVNPNSLVSIINKNKDKKVLATKIIETNPKILPIIPKLHRDVSINSDMKKDNYNINRGLLEDIYSRVKTITESNKQITKLFPDIELSIQILVSSILSPKKMTDIQLNYKLKKNIELNPSVSSKLLELVKEYINENYELEDKLTDIVREALFETGAYVLAIIPESSVDETINTDLLANLSTEQFKEKVDKVLDRLVSPLNIAPNINKSKTEEDKISKESFVESLVSSSLVNITDNVGIFKYNEIKNKLQSSLIKNSFRSRSSIAQESADKISYFDIFRDRKRGTSTSNVEIIKHKHETNRKSIGKPMVTKIPTESIIPVFIPGNEAEHIGYFVLLDESGKPLSTELKDSSVSSLNVQLHQQSNNNSSSPIQKAYNNLTSDSSKGVNINELFELYKTVLERQIYSSIKSSMYTSNAEFASRNDVYFLMFTRALAVQKTNILFIPKELVVYYAFQYNDIGIGKTLLENLSVLSSMRAIMLFSKVMAYAKQSIDVTKVNISLDPNDPDPEKTIEQIQDSVLKLRQNFFPLGMNNPIDLLNWIQRAGLQFSYDNNPLIPNVKIDFENANISHTIPSSELEEELRKQTIISLGLSPETVDSGFSPEFATTVVNNNILLSKRVAVYQKSLTKHLSKQIEMFIYNDEDLRKLLKENILESIEVISETLTEEEKTILTKDRGAFVEYYIDLLSTSIRIELPKPDNTNITSLIAEFEIYKNGLDQVIESIISEEMFSENISGDISTHINTIRNIYRNYLLRKWMSENNFYPEALEISGDSKDDVENMLQVITTHLTSTMRNSDVLINKMQQFKLAVNKDISKIEGDGSEATVSDNTSTSEETGSSEEDDLVSDTDEDLDFK